MSASDNPGRWGNIVKSDGSLINEGDILDPTPLENSATMLNIIAGAAVSLAVPAKAISAKLYPSEEIRFWLDGTVPTASSGVICCAGGEITLESRAELEGFKAIAVSDTATTAVLFFRQSEEV